jgi:hypothetical protein
MTATFSQTRIANGWWEAVLSGHAGSPGAVVARHEGAALPGVEVGPLTGQPDKVAVRVPIPASILSDGVQIVLVEVDGRVCGQFAVIAGTSADQDLRAELGLLRAELDLLKRAFRRHCAETAGQARDVPAGPA